MIALASTEQPRYLSVKQVADYLNLNEKKVYALVNEGKIPATKVTGKWMFPRELVDRWMLETSHGGALTDRLTIVGSDDPLFSRLTFAFAEQAQAQALVSYSPTGTKLGLALMQNQRARTEGESGLPQGARALQQQQFRRQQQNQLNRFRTQQGSGYR
jgi:excisionase family DNA binding protein